MTRRRNTEIVQQILTWRICVYRVFAVLFLMDISLIHVVLGRKPVNLIMESQCGQLIRVETSVLLTVSNWSDMPLGDTGCHAEIQADSPYHEGGSHILLSVQNLDLPGTRRPCGNQSRVDIMDSNETSIDDDSQDRLCGHVSHFSLTSRDDVINLSVFSANRSLDGQLSILVSAFNTYACDPNGEFACDNSRCIDKRLTCNGYDECGDDSDEKDGCWMTEEVIAFIVVGGVMIVVIAILVSVVAVRRKMSWGVGTSLTSSGKFSLNSEDREIIRDLKSRNQYKAL